MYPKGIRVAGGTIILLRKRGTSLLYDLVMVPSISIG